MPPHPFLRTAFSQRNVLLFQLLCLLSKSVDQNDLIDRYAATFARDFFSDPSRKISMGDSPLSVAYKTRLYNSLPSLHVLYM
jgi:hypothetical protein